MFTRRKKLTYKIGDIIRYNAFGGLGRTVLVEEKEDDVKNGRPGFSGVLVVGPDHAPLETNDPIGNRVWGYDDQITRVVRRG